MPAKRPFHRPPERRGPRPEAPKRPRPPAPALPERTAGSQLEQLLLRIDGLPYGAYRDLVGSWPLGEFLLEVDRVPPDPFAAPARARLSVERTKAGLPPDLAARRLRRIAVEDFLAREAAAWLGAQPGRPRSAAPGSGRAWIEPPGQGVLERGTCRITRDRVELRLFLDLPADRRRVRGLRALELLAQTVASLGSAALLFSSRRVEQARSHAAGVEDHAALQGELSRRGLVAFVGDGSLLARAGGDDHGPRRDGREVPFLAPDALAVELSLPAAGEVRGMGIPAGVTVIVGGGFHGKSTLLEALIAGVHPLARGDGRERVATLPSGVPVRAEPGRAVQRVDLSAFVGELPSGELAVDFSTERASGSTSQAAGIVEALEAGARLLMLDEDSCAANFMTRDGRMQRLVPRPLEPIVPFLDRVRELYDRFGVSTVLVTGGSGDYLEAADTVIRMNAYRPEDVTVRAREIAEATRSVRLREPIPPMRSPEPRRPVLPEGGAKSPPRAGLRGPRGIRVGESVVDLGAVDPLLETGQVRALALLLREAVLRMDPAKSILALLDELDAWLDSEGLDALDPPAAHDLARPRRFEIAAALNRWRTLRVHRPDR
jgi:predicted ABC-class ATPase